MRTDYESLLSAHEEMKSRVSLAEQQLEERGDQASLHGELEAVKAQLSQLQGELREVTLSRDKALSECGGLRSKQEEQRNTIDALNNQLERSVGTHVASILLSVHEAHWPYIMLQALDF